MASSSIQEVPAAAPSPGTGPWLGRLPLEVREVVYQYMLVEKMEHRMKSAEVSCSLLWVNPICANTINL